MGGVPEVNASRKKASVQRSAVSGQERPVFSVQEKQGLRTGTRLEICSLE
jgi:hypothetical protein